MKNVLITTIHKGVWFAQISEDANLSNPTLYDLKNAVMAIRWGTTNGLQQLCASGPTEESKLSEASDILVLHDVTAVFLVSPEAAAKVWNSN